MIEAATLAAATLRAASAKAPRQARSQQRMALVMEAAEAMIGELGPEAVSIPDVALSSGVPRSSIYQFFPDKYALFGAIAERHLARVAAAVAAAGAEHPAAGYAGLVQILVDGASDYYEATPVASILVLGGPFSPAAYLAQANTIGDIGREVRTLMLGRPEPVTLPERPDAATLAVEIAFACIKHGYFRERRLSREIRREAARAATAYISLWT